ncbi:hypothetical protein GCM10025867_50960 (plasmid) [Frondihabitans sucicola]|uniref:Uncharacterized protein n=1 Tax=Frondihabitans sucicola TaxID=1268041 RepID=A0ABN6Y689_9MICO|nr:hypothetical protein [Frondihabitans sucicola]BDZ52855.1 hypothetical protein GCM10025867_50960 [Frondihabitans sucicola]
MSVLGLSLLFCLGLLGAVCLGAFLAAAAEGIDSIVRTRRGIHGARASRATARRMLKLFQWSAIAFISGAVVLARVPIDVDPALSTLALVMGAVGGGLVAAAIALTKIVGAPASAPATEGTRN